MEVSLDCLSDLSLDVLSKEDVACNLSVTVQQ